MCTAWFLAGWMALAQVSAPPAAELEQKARRLIRQLESEVAADRDAAAKQLLDLGPAVLPYLKPPKDADADLETHLDQIRVTLQTIDAHEFTSPRTITLSGPKPLSKVLAELEKQGETRLFDYRARFGESAEDPELTLQLDKVPFWRALDQVLDAAGLVRYPHADRRGIALQNAPSTLRRSTGRASYPGAFRIEAVDIHGSRNLRREGSGAVTLNVEIAWETRLRPFVFYQDLRATRMEDERGRPLECEKTNSTREVGVAAESASTTISMSLATPPREVKRIGRVTGKLECLMPGKVAKFQFANLKAITPGKEQATIRQGGAVVSIKQIQKNGPAWEIQLLVQFEKGLGALESYRDWALENPCALVGPDGKPIPHAPPTLFSRTESQIGVAYAFTVDDLKDCKLTYETPVLIVKVPLEFELKDIELP